MGLLLTAVDVVSRHRWRWLLLDETTGTPLADHAVQVDPAAVEWAALNDLYRWMQINADPDPARRIASSASLVDRVGRWITSILLGEPVVAAIAAAAPTTIRVQVPDLLGDLRLRPLELAHSDGRPLAAGGDVAFVYQLTEAAIAPRHTSHIERGELRMVAVFSLPDRTSMLALRRERHALTRLVRQLAVTTRRAIVLEVLQYGVTRQILAERVAAIGGCDVLHISAHGSSDTLLLENPDGTPDPVSSDQLIKLLRPARGRVRLAVVSACESAAAAVVETLHWLSIETSVTNATRGSTSPEADGSISISADRMTSAPIVRTGTEHGREHPSDEQPTAGLARRIGLDLGCAVVAMRYPVVDEFAISWADRFYRNLFQLNLPVHTATSRAIAETLDRGPSPARPPLSIATPALLTPTPELADLRFDPPRSAPVLAEMRMVGFPDEPERFVGRATAMARASTALAPDSRSTGVLFHGMAGVGKTACVLELAYRHRDTFTMAVFWQAPLHDDQWAGALTSLALTLEHRLRDHGFAMVDKIGTAETFTAFLPGLRRMLADTSLLLVLDNLESLLTSDGDWRDPRWADLIDTLTGHGGLTRVALTCRTRPTGLDPGVVVLPVHALSRDETVLLARELPHLARLLHADGSHIRHRTATGVAATAEQVEQDRNLVRRTLTVVQGHPKLLELADAAAEDPDQLAVHLDAAEAVADTERLAAFLTYGDSSLDPDGFLTILTGWTTSTLGTLPEPALLLLQALCTMEDDDRTSAIVEPVWGVLWQQLHSETEAADLDQAVQRLTAAALIQPEPQLTADSGHISVVRYRIHPGIADTVHATTPSPVVTAARQAMSDFWYTVFRQATRGPAGEHTSMVVRAGLAAAPYLIALQDYEVAAFLLERAVVRDSTPAAAQVALPYLRNIVQATGRTDDAGILARVVARFDPGEAEQLLHEVLRRARDDGDHRLAAGIAGDLINLLQNAGRLSDALDLNDTTADLANRAGLGPWTQLAGRCQRLQILHRMGHLDQVLTEVHHLRDQLAYLPDQAGEDETVQPWNVRETILDLGSYAAAGLRRWQTALDLAHEEVTSLQQRGASNHAIARVRFNTYGPLLNLGMLDQAEAVLLATQQVFEIEQDITSLARTLGARAALAYQRGHTDDAAALQRTAIRLNYVNPQPSDIARSHHNLGLYLARNNGDQGEAIAHHLAAGLLDYLIGDTRATESRLRTLAVNLRKSPPPTPPKTLADLAAVVERVDGVHYTAMIAALTGGSTDTADQALTHLIQAARMTATSEPEPNPHLAAWEPILASLVAAIRGDGRATKVLRETFRQYADDPDWSQLIDRLRRIQTGQRDPRKLTAGLDPIDAAIIRRALDAVAGRIRITTVLDQAREPDDRAQPTLGVQVGAPYVSAQGTTPFISTKETLLSDPEDAPLLDRI